MENNTSTKISKWKQFWCNHVYEEINDKFLRQERKYDSSGGYNIFKVYGVTHKCLKCDKTHIKEKWELLI